MIREEVVGEWRLVEARGGAGREYFLVATLGGASEGEAAAVRLLFFL